MWDLMSFLAFCGLFALVLALLMLVLGYKYRDMQDSMLYFPDNPPGSGRKVDDPIRYGITTAERVTVTTGDGVSLQGFWVHPATRTPETPVLVYFHGNAGNVGHRLPIARMFIEAVQCSVLMMDYRSYGTSDRQPANEEGLESDGEAVLDYVIARGVPPSRIFVMGVSLGGAVSCYLASRKKYSTAIAGLILENTFTSIRDMVDALFTPFVRDKFPSAHRWLLPVLRNLVLPLVLQIGWCSRDRIAGVGSPILFLAGQRDEIVPPEQMQRMYDSATKSSRRTFVPFPQGTHNDLPGQPGYVVPIKTFVDTVCRERPRSDS